MSRAQLRMLILALTLLLWAHTTVGALVKWRPNTSFNLPLNFQDNKLPCGRQSVHFSDKLFASVRINSKTNVESLVLPIDGKLDLSDGAAIYFGDEPSKGDERSKDCVAGDTYYMERSRLAWLQADAWDADNFNAATPDAQRIPCFDDDVVFPRDVQFSIILPNETQYVSSININGVNVDGAQFKSLALDSYEHSQAFVLNSALWTGVQIEAKPCQSRAGCPCQYDATIVDCSLKACDIPQCTDPIRPDGNCCPICGGVLQFKTNVNTFNFMSFKKRVEKVVEENGGPSKIIYHVGLLSKDKMQVVMIDRDEYEGASSMALQVLDRSLGDGVVSGMRQSLISGTPLAKVGTGWEVVVVPLLVALLVFAGVYVWYQKPQVVKAIPLPRLPTQTPAVFSRFNNRENSISSLTSRASVAFGSFKNPLYDSERRKAGRSDSDASAADAPGSVAVVASTSAAAAGPSTPARAAHVADEVTRMSNLISLDE